jgi:hypothetical protein
VGISEASNVLENSKENNGNACMKGSKMQKKFSLEKSHQVGKESKIPENSI